MQAYCYAYHYGMPSSFDFGSAVPCIDLAIQSLGETFQGDDGKYYQADTIGDRDDEIFEGVYVTGVTELQFTSLTGLTISDFQGDGVATVDGNNVILTGTNFSSVEFSNGSYYSAEFINGSIIYGEQSCTIIGTASDFIEGLYPSYRNKYGYNEQAELSGDYGSDYGSDYA